MDPMLPSIALAAPDGARAAVCTHGAHLVSWIPARGRERLFVSQSSAFQPGLPVRGGVPVVFPQFGGLGPLPRHGFARVLAWEPVLLEGDADPSAAALCLRDSDSSRAQWPHAFRVDLRFKVGGPRLDMRFSVTNTGATAFTFTAALHTYFRVDDVLTTCVRGLSGLSYLDTTRDPWSEAVQKEPGVTFPAEVDRIYRDAPTSLEVMTPGEVTRVESTGFPDVVIWNPGPEKGAALPDLEPDGYRRFVCVEAAVVEPVALDPGRVWQGCQSLTAVTATA